MIFTFTFGIGLWFFVSQFFFIWKEMIYWK
jgi:hypothetical protein